MAGPDGAATLDLAEKLPGRGAWVAADRAALQQAVKRGHFKRVIGAGFGEIDAETDRIKHLMRDRVIACASMARRAGLLIGGAGKLLAGGQCAGLIIAPDASQREARRLESRLGTIWTTNCLSAAELGQICGRNRWLLPACAPSIRHTRIYAENCIWNSTNGRVLRLCGL